jgi:DNA-binding NarL/FixJ family response regulator
MKKVRLLIADDHSVVREGIRSLLKSSPRYKVIAEAEDGEEAVRKAQVFNPDVTIMDISMPKLSGLDATGIMKENNPKMKIVILTVHEDEEYVYRILKAGASGYVLKSSGRKDLFTAIESAISGERFFSPGVSKMITESFIKRPADGGVVSSDRSANQKSILTRRETEILQLIAQGCTNRRIADKLFLSVRTVNTHRTNLMKKLDIHDTARLVHYAIENNLVDLKKE